MILSHDHKFIFLKTNKTAGTSMELALAKFCGPNDIITPVSPMDEELRNDLGHRGPQHYDPSVKEYALRDWLVMARRLRRKRFYNHMPATDVKMLVGEEIWSSYFKFCFERNPWDRMLSLYAWRCQHDPKPTLAEFIGSKAARDLTKRGIDVYTIGGKLAVDRVCRYEDLSTELEFLKNRLGLPEPITLPRAKAAYRRDRRPYREILARPEANQIALMFQREIALFGYEY